MIVYVRTRIIALSAFALGVFALSVLAVLASCGAGNAQEFFAGKTLSIIAGFPPGGGVDGEMRVLTRYFAKYIPGNPVIVSRNMQGAGGIILANHLYNVAAPDALTLGMPGRSGFLLSNVVPQKGINYDLTKFSYVGGAGSAANALWVSRRTGITSIAELKASKKELVIGALNPRSENAISLLCDFHQLIDFFDARLHIVAQAGVRCGDQPAKSGHIASCHGRRS